MRTRCLYTVTLLLWGTITWPAAAFHARMEIDPQVVRIGESAELRIVVEGVRRGKEPELPEVHGLRITGPAVESSMQVSTVNGRMQQTRSITYRYTVIPEQSGNFTIGPLTYTHEGQSKELAAQELQVVAPSGTTGRAGEEQTVDDFVFGRLTVDRERVFVNQDLSLEIAIYSRELNIGREINLLDMPESGLQMQPFQELQRIREVVDNEIYDVRRYRTTIRPLTAGTIRLAPTLRVQVLVPRQRERRGFFDDPFFRGIFADTETHPHMLTLDPVEVVVQGLPTEDRPEGFTGGVGQFDFEVNVHPTAVSVGDPLTVTLRIEGEGNIDTIGPPAVAESDEFRVFAPRVSHTDIARGGQRGRKTFEQVIIPRTAKADVVPALSLYYFDPQAETYQSVTRGPFPLELEVGEEAAQRLVRADETANGQARILGQDIAYLQPTPAQWRRRDDPVWYRQPWFWGLQLVPLLALVGVYGWARRRRALATDVAKARRERAPKAARAGLRAAEQALRTQNAAAFYDGLWTGLVSYFGDRFNMPSGAVTADQVQQRLQATGADAALIDAAEALFTACEQWRFAGARAVEPERMRALLADFRNLLRACERGPR